MKPDRGVAGGVATARRLALVAGAVALVALAGCMPGPEAPPDVISSTSGGAAPPAGVPPLRLVKAVDGLHDPVFVTAYPGGGLAVVEQEGLVRVVADGTPWDTPLLDIRDRVLAGGERGLLGLAFDPAGDALYVYYTGEGGDIRIARHAVRDGAADPEGTELLRIPHAQHDNHNGGMLAFGPDGFLYIGVGDGGSGGDPDNHAQDPHSLLGKILRIDVHGTGVDDIYRPVPYGIPPGNPFARGGGAPEVWDYGLRNPWRFSFDRESSDLWIGDVGQNAYEEIDLERAGGKGGVNYGWSAFEGAHTYDTDREAPGAVAPVFELPQAGTGSCAITGGYVYRGNDVPGLRGTYLFSDYCSGDLWAMRGDGSGWDAKVVLETHLSVSSFGEDAAGEVYVVDHGGALYRVSG